MNPFLPPPGTLPQALFRPMSMMIPDYALVAEVMLFRGGGGRGVLQGHRAKGERGDRADAGRSCATSMPSWKNALQ